MISHLIDSPLMRRAAIYTLANAVNVAVPFLLLPILTRHLTPEEYGLVAMFTVLAALVVAIAGLGTHGVITREYFYLRREEFASFVGTCLFILVVGSAALICLVALFGKLLREMTGIPENWLVVAVLMGVGQLLCSIGLSIWQLRGLPLRYGVFQICVSLSNMLLSLVLVVGLEMGWQGRIVGQVAAVATMGVLAIATIAYEDWIRFHFSLEHFRKSLRYGVPLMFHALGAIAISTADRTLITNLVSIKDTGLYYVAAQIAMVITFLADSFNRAYAPWLFERLKEGNSAVKHQIVVGTYWYFSAVLVLALLLTLVAPSFVSFIVGQDFAGASRYLTWLSLASAFGGMYYMVTLYVQFSGKTEHLAATTLTVGTFNIFLCYAMIQWQGSIGAAQATLISQVVFFFVTWWMASRLVPMGWFQKRKSQSKPF